MDHALTDRRLAILSKAASRGHAHAGTVEDWRTGIERLVKRAQRPGEGHATAYARVTAAGDGRAFLACLRKAEDHDQAERRGRPRKYDPGEIQRSRIETALSDAALDLARATGVSFESAFARVLDTPAGRDLYTALRAAAPDSGE